MQNIYKLFILLLASIIISCGDNNPINDDNKISVKTGDAIVIGKITDDSGNPISGAEIDIEGNRTVTDSYGEFKIDNAAEGEVNLKISAENYFSLSKKIQTVKDKATYLPYKLASIDYEMTIKPEMVKTIKLNDLNIKLTINKIIAPGNYEIPEAQLRLTEFEKHTISLPEQYNTPEKFNGMFNPKAAMRIELKDKNGDEVSIEGSISFSEFQEEKIAGKQSVNKDYSFYSINEDVNKIDDIHFFKLSSTTSIVIANEANEYSSLKIVDLQDNPIKNTPLSTNNYLGWTYVSNSDGMLNNFFDRFHSPEGIAYIYHNEEVLSHVPYSNSNGAITFPINKSLEARYTLEDFNITSTLYSVDMFFLNENEIFVYTGDLYYSSNKGESWEKRKSNIHNPDYQLIQMYFKDNMNGIANFDGIQTTSDGGYTWEKLDQFKDIQVMFFELFEDNTGILITKDKERYRTKDRGKNWTKLNKNVSVEYFNPKQIEFVNENLGYGTFAPGLGSGSYVRITTDGGINWEPVPLQGGGDLSAYFAGFVDETDGYLSTNRELRKTIDGGQTWNVIDGNEDYTHSADIDITLNDQAALTTWDMDYLHNYKIEDDTLKFLDKFSYQHKLKISASVCWTFSLDAENKWYYTGAHLIRRRGAE